MEKLTLKEIARVLGCEVSADADITDISTDTRNITPGSLFIAIEGERFDAHDFVGQAAQKGASAVVVHKDVQCSAPVLRVEDTVEAYLDIAGYYRDRYDIPLIGLTGSVGKTTTKDMVALAMSAGYKTLKTQANFNNHIGMPKTLLELDSSYSAAVIEMGMNHFGEISALSRRCKPTMGIITNIGVSHIENLGSREGILRAKLELLEGLKPDAPLILNGDNDLLSKVKLEDRRVYFFGIENKEADFLATDISSDSVSTSFTVSFKEGRQKITLPTVGNHNVLNALAAFAAAYLNGVSPESIAEALSGYVPSGMRQKVVDCGNFKVIEDCYNASPDSMRASLSTLANMPGGKKVAVLGDMLELGKFSEQLHREVGEFAAKCGIDELLCFGKEAAYIALAAREASVKEVRSFSDREEFINEVCGRARDSAVLLFKASHGMHFEEIISELYERNGIK